MRALVLLIFLVASASATFFQDCGSVGSNVEVNVEGCDVPPCILERGQTIDVNIKFTASRSSQTLTVDAGANIGGIQVPWPGVDTNGCLYTACPFAAGSRVDWTMPVDILREYPAISTIVTFRLVDGNGDFQACAVLPATIV
ncbi:NPC intracellular cholesterol transporter 2-like [Panulirus ornatus]|uniref:NPC intracellular cholesterol transporter 2-like n=1 Tax=Panulirus ornatus TaxID=150431 RepID=UPI003A89AA62